MAKTSTQIKSFSERGSALRQTRNLKMAESAHAYVRGNTRKFYEWLAAPASGKVPQGPPIWICGDCHVGNLSPWVIPAGKSISRFVMDNAVLPVVCLKCGAQIQRLSTGSKAHSTRLIRPAPEE